MSVNKNLLLTSIHKLETWIEEHQYKGYEPFDGLSSVFRPLTFNSCFAQQILQQVIRQSPVNLRPLLGVKPLESTKGTGYIAWGYLKMFKLTGEPSYRKKAERSLDWLIRNKSPLYEHFSWGNHFDYASRSGRLPKHCSTIVWTSLIGQTFLDAYEILGADSYLDVATSSCTWILGLTREKTAAGACLSYTAQGQNSIHNSNMLGAAMLARTATFTGNAEYRQVAREAMGYSCAGQLPDGAWYYGEAPKNHWIDNFHTGYNLDSLKCYSDATHDTAFEENLRRGYAFFKNHFFEESGRPKYYYNRAYPIDIQCASQAIDTLVQFSDTDTSALDLACKVAEWTIQNMQDQSGYFYYRILPFMKVKIPMIHWGQATMYKALSCLLLNIQG